SGPAWRARSGVEPADPSRRTGPSRRRGLRPKYGRPPRPSTGRCNRASLASPDYEDETLVQHGLAVQARLLQSSKIDALALCWAGIFPRGHKLPSRGPATIRRFKGQGDRELDFSNGPINQN